ncbi:Rieske 2Fe-2S domain-containing protein [Acidimicrobiia bacterium EGI L10123]|uniref:QcrA and Rieske domain-containing protein n=1 Tax=Salinilacustrithrix flava TaxID=2957203 RepID=UPI003D7C25C4|nr:Rieske 2Fe-2S domain-containing protein [Acidimicrobiia bacterium EGI L10123]
MKPTDVLPLRPWAVARLAVLLAGGAGALVTGVTLLFTRDDHGPAGAALGIGALALGAAFATVAKHLLGPPDDEEERHAPGSPACQGCDPETRPQTRRRLVVGGSAVAVLGAVGGGALLRGRTDARRELRETSWRRGDAVVTDDGRPVQAGDLAPGSFLTVFPDHAIGAADSQAVLLRVDTRRLGNRPRFEELAPDGHVAYSKLCTHMGCPVGLFQQDPDVLVCPCHQAVFDVLDGARPVQGPADRPLPQLPLVIDDDGTLRAGGGFTGPVGPGWWGRPR